MQGQQPISPAGAAMLRRAMALILDAEGEPYTLMVFLSTLATTPEQQREHGSTAPATLLNHVDRHNLRDLAEALAWGLSRRLLELSLPESLRQEQLFEFSEGRRLLRIMMLCKHETLAAQVEPPAEISLGPVAWDESRLGPRNG